MVLFADQRNRGLPSCRRPIGDYAREKQSRPPVVFEVYRLIGVCTGGTFRALEQVLRPIAVVAVGTYQGVGAFSKAPDCSCCRRYLSGVGGGAPPEYLQDRGVPIGHWIFFRRRLIAMIKVE